MGPMVDVYKGPLVFCLLVLGQNVGKTIKNFHHGYQAIDYAGAVLAVVWLRTAPNEYHGCYGARSDFVWTRGPRLGVEGG
jgi:hypothetical protein